MNSTVSKYPFLYLLGLDYQVQNFVVDNKRFALRLWDSAGQERWVLSCALQESTLWVSVGCFRGKECSWFCQAKEGLFQKGLCTACDLINVVKEVIKIKTSAQAVCTVAAIRRGAKSGDCLGDFISLLVQTSSGWIGDRLKCSQVPQHHQAVLPEGGRRGADVRHHFGVFLLGRAVLAELHPGG